MTFYFSADTTMNYYYICIICTYFPLYIVLTAVFQLQVVMMSSVLSVCTNIFNTVKNMYILHATYLYLNRFLFTLKCDLKILVWIMNAHTAAAATKYTLEAMSKTPFYRYFIHAIFSQPCRINVWCTYICICEDASSFIILQHLLHKNRH